jgi:hypothetical protein
LYDWNLRGFEALSNYVVQSLSHPQITMDILFMVTKYGIFILFFNKKYWKTLKNNNLIFLLNETYS